MDGKQQMTIGKEDMNRLLAKEDKGNDEKGTAKEI